jgi:Transcriptional regulator
MNTLHLKYIVEVAKTGSITLAAENLYMNQPNLSKAIKEIENTVGICIFKRTSKGIVPTKKGEEFLYYARNILAQVEEMEKVFNTDPKNKIAFSISVPRGSYISQAFTQFVLKQDSSKELDLNFKETNSIQTINDVSEGEYNLGIIRYKKSYENYFLNYLKDKGLRYEDVFEFEYYVLISQNNPLSTYDFIANNDLNKCLEIVHGDLSVPYLSFAEVLKNEKYKRRRVFVYERGSQLDLLNQIEDSFMLVSPLPSDMLNRYGLLQKRYLSSNQLYKDVIIYQKGYQLSKFDKDFIEELNLVKASISSI